MIKVAVFLFLVLTISACSDDTTYKAQDAGGDVSDVGTIDATDDDAADTQGNDSSAACAANPSGAPYLVLESSTRMDIDAVSVRPCENNSEAFVYQVYDYVLLDEDSVQSIKLFPDSTCNDGFVELGREVFEFISVEFFNQPIKKGDQIIIYPKACDGYTLDTSTFNLYLFTADGDKLESVFEETEPGVFLVTFAEGNND